MNEIEKAIEAFRWGVLKCGLWALTLVAFCRFLFFARGTLLHAVRAMTPPRRAVLALFCCVCTIYAGLKYLRTEFGVNDNGSDAYGDNRNTVVFRWIWQAPVTEASTLYCDYRMTNEVVYAELFSCPVTNGQYSITMPLNENSYEFLLYTDAGVTPVHTNGVYVIYSEPGKAPFENHVLIPQAEIRTETETYKAPNIQ